MLYNTRFSLDNLLISQKAVHLHCVFHSIRFKVNKGWSKALLLFLCPYFYIVKNRCIIKTSNYHATQQHLSGIKATI